MGTGLPRGAGSGTPPLCPVAKSAEDMKGPGCTESHVLTADDQGQGMGTPDRGPGRRSLARCSEGAVKEERGRQRSESPSTALFPARRWAPENSCPQQGHGRAFWCSADEQVEVQEPAGSCPPRSTPSSSRSPSRDPLGRSQAGAAPQPTAFSGFPAQRGSGHQRRAQRDTTPHRLGGPSSEPGWRGCKYLSRCVSVAPPTPQSPATPVLGCARDEGKHDHTESRTRTHTTAAATTATWPKQHKCLATDAQVNQRHRRHTMRSMWP